MLFVTTLIFFPGSIAGDFEQVYSMAKIIVDFDISIKEFNSLNSQQINEYIRSPDFIGTEPFVLRNYVFIFLLSYLVKFLNFLNIFLLFNESELKFVTELIISFFPTFLFLFSPFLLYKSYENKFNKNILLFGIFLFFFSSYLINFVSSHFFAEASIFFLISLRIYLKQKGVGLLYLTLIDFLLIKIRVTCYVIVAFFLMEEFLKKKTKLKKYFIYLLIMISLSLIYKLLSFQSNENEIIGKILKSACIFDENITSIVFNYFNKIYLSFFSLNLGILFIFPLFILFIYNLVKNFKDKVIILKFLTISIIISLFALEEYWYLPAGISGHRGIAPFLVIIFPEILKVLKSLIKKDYKITVFTGFLLYLFFFTSVDYRSTTGFWSMCGTINKPCISFFTLFNKELDYLYRSKTEIAKKKCRHPNLFSNSDLRMHPGVYGWRVLSSKLLGKNEIRIYYKKTDGLKEKFKYDSKNINYQKGYFDQKIVHFIPHTMISRISYAVNLKLDLASDKKIINEFKINSTTKKIINFSSFFIMFFYMFFPIYFFSKRFKII